MTFVVQFVLTDSIFDVTVVPDDPFEGFCSSLASNSFVYAFEVKEMLPFSFITNEREI